MRAERLVLDTNVLISAAIQPAGPSRAAFEWVRARERVLVFSWPTWDEFTSRLFRPRLDRYFPAGVREGIIVQAGASAQFVAIRGLSMGCRDPDDDKVIETALTGGAEVIVTGDEDLLSMPPRPEFQVLTPRAFLSL